MGTNKNEDGRKAVRKDPIAGEEPIWVHDLPLDNILGGMTTLLAELCILRDRVRTLERELADAKVLSDDAVDQRVSSEEEKKLNETEIKAIVDRFWGEVTRERGAWSHVPASTDPEKQDDKRRVPLKKK